MAHPQDSAAHTESRHFGSVKDTLESIVVAFILAFVFRAFLLEAFVIPTGSMATTLYGQQITHTCTTCGFEYARGITPEEVITAHRSPAWSITLRCPNCDTMDDQFAAEQIRQPDSGDRILIWKWAYDIGYEATGPQRWDVAVFKNPSNATDNYIKRLVGVPGEVLQIIDGDIYAAKLETLQQDDPDLAADFIRITDELNTQREESNGRYVSRDFLEAYADLNQRILPHLRIRPKTERAQEALWFNVYDHNFLPTPTTTGQARSPVGWDPVDEAAAEAWKTRSREVTFASTDERHLAIRFAGKPITDYMAYNFGPRQDQSERAEYAVGDIRLRFVWMPEAGDGSLQIASNRDLDAFVAEIHMDGTVTLERIDARLPGGRRTLDERRLPRPLRAGKTYDIKWLNVDHRARLLIDGQEVVSTNDENYHPDLPRRLAVSRGQADDVRPTEVRIAARRLQCTLRHLRLDRDVYYRSSIQTEQNAPHPVTGEPQSNPFYGWPGWGTAGMPIFLRPEREVDGRIYPGEYFALGDNSPNSKDSRRWWQIGPQLHYLGAGYQLGTVPHDQLVGKSFFVYWPAGYRPTTTGNIGLIPNVGKMRWIR